MKYQFELSDLAQRDHNTAYEKRLAAAEAALERIRTAPPGFVTVVEDDAALKAAERVAAQISQPNVAVLGIGGSALGARTIADALIPQGYGQPSSEGRPGLQVLDNIDPHTVSQAVPDSALPHTTFVAISKSGSTAETISQLLYFKGRFQHLGEDWRPHFVIVTDPDHGPLRELATREGLPTLDVPGNVGGRFSVLTAVGLLPAVILGLDAAALVRGARQIRDGAFRSGSPVSQALCQFVAAQATLTLDSGRTGQVLMSYCDRLRTFGDWFCQLWAESLGKRLSTDGEVVHRGSTPIGAVGATDQHSLVQLFTEGPDDKQFVIVGVEDTPDPCKLSKEAADLHPEFSYLANQSLAALFDAERSGTIKALRAAGRPTSELILQRLDAEHLGGLFLFFELATALAGDLYNVDPFDQPGVEAGKIAAFALMGREGYQERAASLLGSDNRSRCRHQFP